jgi:hypothetical protein
MDRGRRGAGGQPVSLASLFPEDAILRALIADRLVKTALHGQRIPESLDALLPKLLSRTPSGMRVTSGALSPVSWTTSDSSSTVGSGAGAVACRLPLSVSAVSGFVPV